MRRRIALSALLAAWLFGAQVAQAQQRVIFQTPRPPFQQPRAPFQTPGPGPAVWIVPWARTQPVVAPGEAVGRPVVVPDPRFLRGPAGPDRRDPADRIPPGGN
jgi:hypothetical protein